MQKRCTRCGAWKPQADFARDRSKRLGLKSHCRDCDSTRFRAQSAKNREHGIARVVARRSPRKCVTCSADIPKGKRWAYCPPCREAAKEARRAGRRTGAAWRGFKPEPRECLACHRTYTAHAPGAKFCSSACGQRYRGETRATPEERGYGRAHRELRARWAPRVAAGDVKCARCHQKIEPGAPWDLDHEDEDRSRYLGPSHASCNRATSSHRLAAQRASRAW